MILWMGIWRIGAAVCPLNIEMNIAYVSELLQTIGPKMTLWQTDLDGATMTEGVDGDIIEYASWNRDAEGDVGAEEIFAQLAAYPDGPEIEAENASDDVACIYCTSGTTDKPKLIVCDHMGYWLFGLSSIEQVGHTENERTLDYRSMSWNSAQGMSLMPWLQTGCTLHFARRFSAKPILRLGQDPWHHLRRWHPDGDQHALEPPARHHRQGYSHAAADELLDRALVARALGAVRGNVRD